MEKLELTKEDYKECLKFILKLRYLWGGSTADFASSGIKRDVGKYIHDHMGGKLAEIATKKYLHQKFGLEVKLGFDEYHSADDFMLGDIEKVKLPDGSAINPKLKVEIKETKPSSRWWLISDDEFNSRRYDVYILVVVDLPLDHIIRYFKANLSLSDEKLEAAIPDFGKIDAEIRGIVWRGEFENNTLRFDIGDHVFETEIFEERRRIVGETVEIKLTNDEFSLSHVPGSFKIAGQYKLLVRNMTRNGNQIGTKYLKTISDVVVSHKMLGEYHLEKDKFFLIADKNLSPLRIANRGYPVRNIPNKKETWERFLQELI